MKDYQIKANYTGQYPNYCCGKWIIQILGIPLVGIESDSMRTYGTYTQYRWDDEGPEEIEVTRGLNQEDWIQEVLEYDLNGLKTAINRAGIEITEELLEQLYDEVSVYDWIHGQCGGCI